MQTGGGSIADSSNGYNLTVSPVTLIAGTTPIVLGPTMNSLSANYPVATVATGFNSATQKSLMAGNTTVKYSDFAQLPSMKAITECPNFQNLTPPTWKLASLTDHSGGR